MEEAMRKRESDYMGKVAELPCAICGDMPVHVHHLRHARNAIKAHTECMETSRGYGRES